MTNVERPVNETTLLEHFGGGRSTTSRPSLEELNKCLHIKLYKDNYGRNICHLIASMGATDPENAAPFFVSDKSRFPIVMRLVNLDYSMLFELDHFGRDPWYYADTERGFKLLREMARTYEQPDKMKQRSNL